MEPVISEADSRSPPSQGRLVARPALPGRGGCTVTSLPEPAPGAPRGSGTAEEACTPAMFDLLSARAPLDWRACVQHVARKKHGRAALGPQRDGWIGTRHARPAGRCRLVLVHLLLAERRAFLVPALVEFLLLLRLLLLLLRLRLRPHLRLIRPRLLPVAAGAFIRRCSSAKAPKAPKASKARAGARAILVARLTPLVALCSALRPSAPVLLFGV